MLHPLTLAASCCGVTAEAVTDVFCDLTPPVGVDDPGEAAAPAQKERRDRQTHIRMFGEVG